MSTAKLAGRVLLKFAAPHLQLMSFTPSAADSLTLKFPVFSPLVVALNSLLAVLLIFALAGKCPMCHHHHTTLSPMVMLRLQLKL